MKRILCIFAHPDDETAAAGTIALRANDHEIYIVCATSGDSGENHHANKKELLPFIREDELRNSAEILGVKQVSFLGMPDGCLCNNKYHDLARKIANHIEAIRPDVLLTFEPRGITGHLDHIAVSYVATYVFLHQQHAKKLMYACMTEAQRAQVSKLPEYFVYFPPGYQESEADEVIDVSSVWEKKISSVRAHVSQKKDVETFMLPVLQNAPKEEFFLVRRK